MGQAAPRGTRFALDRRPEGWFMRIPLSRFLHLVLAATLALAPVAPAGAAPRIKDISDFEGMRDNMLVGYGLVVGLNGSGDSLRNAPFTRQSLIAMLERLGVNTRDATLNTQNVAAVMVTASGRGKGMVATSDALRAVASVGAIVRVLVRCALVMPSGWLRNSPTSPYLRINQSKTRAS